MTVDYIGNFKLFFCCNYFGNCGGISHSLTVNKLLETGRMSRIRFVEETTKKYLHDYVILPLEHCRALEPLLPKRVNQERNSELPVYLYFVRFWQCFRFRITILFQILQNVRHHLFIIRHWFPCSCSNWLTALIQRSSTSFHCNVVRSCCVIIRFFNQCVHFAWTNVCFSACLR